MQWCRKQTEPLRVVTLICDQGAKYLSKAFNDFWMIDQGFITREETGRVGPLFYHYVVPLNVALVIVIILVIFEWS